MINECSYYCYCSSCTEYSECTVTCCCLTNLPDQSGVYYHTGTSARTNKKKNFSFFFSPSLLSFLIFISASFSSLPPSQSSLFPPLFFSNIIGKKNLKKTGKPKKIQLFNPISRISKDCVWSKIFFDCPSLVISPLYRYPIFILIHLDSVGGLI